jgi:hypothetical protein
MRVEVDQSWKIENTNKHSVLAFSDGFASSVLIPAKDKKLLQEFFRAAGKPEMFVYRTFAILAYHLVKDCLDKIDTIVFDREYPSKEALIKDLFLQLVRKDKPDFDKNSIWFDEIGKKSNAHWEAYWVFKSEKEPTKIITHQMVLKEIL